VLTGGGLRFWSDQGAAELRRIVARLDAAGLGPAAAEPAEPSLEDAFIALLGADAGAGPAPATTSHHHGAPS
jgi:hypothetical protein